MNRPLSCSCLALALFALPLAASAAGLGDLRGQPALGERLRLEIDILGADRPLDASCFRLIRPGSNDDLPWLQQATFSVRSGRPPVLEIRTRAPLRDPVLQIGVQVGCGYEISRQYVVLAMPAVAATSEPAGEAAMPRAEPQVRVPARRAERAGDATMAPPRSPPRRTEPRSRGGLDRLLLSGGGDSGDQPLRLATELGSLRSSLTVSEAQRDILRLEFRMLMVLNEQATTQLATAEKLRNMEATLGDLQMRAGEFAGRVEQSVAPTAPLASPTVPVTPTQPIPVIRREEPAVSEWSLYGVLIGIVLGLAGWLAWRSYGRRPRRDEDFPLLAANPPGAHEPEPVPTRDAAVDIRFEPVSDAATTRVDLELDGGSAAFPGVPAVGAVVQPTAKDSAMSVADATVGEHFEANPVMELADIMLSFGRVKGAAQALREYIDTNPQEALQPWIRLMDVYRMAGMRAEFEEVARNLNQHFNVEVQHWDDAPAAGQATAEPPRPESLEDMPRIMSMISELWSSGDVVGYLYQLLRDNRGGKRAGFALPVVEEILFLIELKETSNRIEKKEDKS